MIKSVISLKEKYAPRSYFFKLFGLMSFMLLLLIVLMAYIVFGKFRDYSEQSLQAGNENIIKQMSYNIQYTSTYINQLLLHLYSRQETTRLLYAIKNDNLLMVSSMLDLDETLVSVPFIDSLYIYNGELKRFYVVGASRYTREQADFGDREVVDWIEHPDNVPLSKPVYRQIGQTGQAGNGASKEVFTYVLYDNDIYPRVIVINVKADWIMNNIQTMSRNQFGPNSVVYIQDSTGQIVEASQTKDRLFAVPLENTCVQTIANPNASPEGRYSCTANGTDYIASYQSIPSMQWRLLVLSTNQFMNNKIHEWRTGIFVISGSLIAIGLLLTLLTAKWLHFPIRRLERNVSALFDGKLGTVKYRNEFTYVNQTLKTMKEDLLLLQSFKSNHLLTLKQDLLKKLLFQPANDARQLEHILKQLNIGLPAKGQFVVVLFKVDQWIEIKNKMMIEQWETIQMDIASGITESLSTAYCCEVIHWEDQWVAVLETTQHPSAKTAGIPLSQPLAHLQKQLNRQLDGSVSLFISPKGDGLVSIGELYKEVAYLSQYRLHFGSGCMLTEEHIYGIVEDNMPFPALLVKQLKDKLVHGEQEAIAQVLSEIFAYFAAYSISNVKFGVFYLLHQVYETISILESNSNITFNFDLIRINQRLNDSETLEEISQVFERVLTRVITKMKERKDDKSSQWADQIKAYIDEHLTDFNLSPSHIASRLNMSTDYVRKQFKKETAISIAGYINQQRVNVLAERLLTSEETIDTLLGEMGWDNKNYFYKLFKDQFGVTPTEYRTTRIDVAKKSP
ncbi:MAG: AraC family transcriptional regulator [Paenibacillaceae bacterium]|nr:AraC family transcriptional regulator [Paenibacillaceae bacterium]